MNLWAYNSLRSGLMYMDEHVVDLKQQSMNLLLVHSNASKLTTEACRYKKNPRNFLLACCKILPRLIAIYNCVLQQL